MYTDVVNYNIAKLLGNKLYGDDKYAAEDLEVTWDNYLTVAEYKVFIIMDSIVKHLILGLK